MLVSSLFPFLLIDSYLRKVLDLLVTHYRSCRRRSGLENYFRIQRFNLAHADHFTENERAAWWNTSRGSQNGFDQLCQTKPSKRPPIDRRRNGQSVVSLEGSDRFPGHWPRQPVDRPIVVTGAPPLFLHLDDDRLGGEPVP